jgi:ATP-dependent Clp protease protease subunit
MPIGVPKVPCRLPGDEDATWVDVYNRLYRERVLFLCQSVGDDIVNQLIAIMIFLSGENNTKDMYLYINSPGGAALPGMSLYDGIQFVVPDVHTICVGFAASMGSLVLTGGEVTKRIALPHARVMLHQPEGAYYQGPTTECMIEAIQMLQIKDCIAKAYAERTHRPIWIILEDMERDTYMSAEEAQIYGLVDLVSANYIQGDNS